MKWAVYSTFVRPTILYECEAWCLKESEIFCRTGRTMVRAMCAAQRKDRKRSTGLMFMLGFCETVDQLAMVNSVCWYGHVLRREDGHVLRRTLDFEVESHIKKGSLKRTWIKQVEEDSVNIALRREDTLC